VISALGDQRGDTLVDRASEAFERYQQGERSAFDDLVEVATPLMWRTARGAGLDQATGEDVVQTVWMSLLRSAESVRDPRTVVKWLLTATKRESWKVSQRARQDRQRAAGFFGVDDEEMLDLPVPAESAPDEIVFADHRQRTLWGHVQALSPRCRQLIGVIAFADRPDYSSLAESLGMPVGSIGPTRGRCLAKLRDELSRDPLWEGITG
jgi:RNA polymerase sigma factor (sigma-70 family)